MENQYSDQYNQTTTPLRPVPATRRVPAGAAPENLPAPLRPRPRWPLWLALGLGVLVIGAGGGFFAWNASLESKYAGKIEPGVSISGVYIGELSRAEAKAAVLKQLDSYTRSPVTLAFQDKSWKPSLEQVGVNINLEASLDKAEAFSKKGDFIGDLRVVKMMSPELHNLPIEIQMDEARLKGYLSDISNLIRRETIEPEVGFDPQGKLVVTEGKEGFNVDYDATYASLKKSLESLVATNENLLKVRNIPPVIGQQEVEEFQKSIAPLLSGPVTVSFKDKSWTFDQKQIADQIKLNRNTDKAQARHLSHTFDASYFEKFINNLSATINQEPRDAEFTWKNAKLIFTRTSLDGQFLSVPRTMDNLNQAFVATDPEKRKTTLWVDVREPAISSDKPERLGDFELIGEGQSSFAGSAYERATNIKVGASYLTNALIKPHSTFSFLDTIGEISQKRGYVEGYAIIAEQTVPDVGGGICQVSTTTFRAAFFAGLPIVERHAHAYRVSWYEEMGEPVGFDAAVYQPGVDFKFENPTDYYMGIEAFVESGKLKVRLYGNKTPGQKVELISAGISNVTSPPADRVEVDPKLAPGQRKQVDYARKGLNTNITRVIKLEGNEIKRDNFATRFQAWPNIFKVGPAPRPVATPSPSPSPNADPSASPPAGSPANPNPNPNPNNPNPNPPAAPPTTAAPAPKPATPAPPAPNPTPKP